MLSSVIQRHQHQPEQPENAVNACHAIPWVSKDSVCVTRSGCTATARSIVPSRGADSGVDGVKVDVQATVGLMGSKLGGGPAMTSTYHRSLESSVRAAFPGNHCINCMCHSTENLYRYGLATTALTA